MPQISSTMKYKSSIDIDLPRKRVVELFDSSENMKQWMPGLESYEHLSGEPGKEGAKAKLRFKMGRRDMEMVETITTNNLPEEMHGTYEVSGTLNVQENFFEEISPEKSRWISVNEFKFNGLGMKLMGWLMPGAFKKQTHKYMEEFKRFAESRG